MKTTVIQFQLYCSIVTVSYTHLDVYKRQGHGTFYSKNKMYSENIIKNKFEIITLVYKYCLLYTSRCV